MALVNRRAQGSPFQPLGRALLRSIPLFVAVASAGAQGASLAAVRAPDAPTPDPRVGLKGGLMDAAFPGRHHRRSSSRA